MLDQIHKFLDTNQLYAYVIFHTDPHQSEYVAPHWQLIPTLTGFTGSNAICIVTKDMAVLWTDSRYWVQAEQELEKGAFTLMKAGSDNTPKPLDWLIKSNSSNHRNIGIDGMMISQIQFEKWDRKLAKNKWHLLPVQNSYDAFWTHRPSPPQAVIANLPHDIEPKSTLKVQDLREFMENQKADAFLLTDPDDVAWLFNVRSKDVPCNTGVISYAIISHDHIYWFVDLRKLDQSQVSAFNSQNVTILPYEDIVDFMSQKEFNKWRFLIDKSQCSSELFRLIPKNQVLDKANPITLKKAIKSEKQIDGIRKSMKDDGIALTRAFFWLEKQLQKGEEVTEYTFAKKLTEYRSKSVDYFSISFDPIVGWRENGAIVHYRPTAEASKKIEGSGSLLCDSGAHYWTGTTDITRTVHFGEAHDFYKKAYTLVLKGHIALANATFPKGTTGVQLDILSRQYLWAESLNFGHGTGHGVGFCSNVHEGPQSISPRVSNYSKTVLKPGMLITNEPGHYEEGRYGIRIENIMLVKEKIAGDDAFLCFESLSLFPIETSFIDWSRISSEEVDWLNRYHSKVREKLIPLLESRDLKFWIMEKTRAVHLDEV